MKLAGWVAGWTDGGGEISIIGIWTSKGEAMAGCQRDVRNGEDMSAGDDPTTLSPPSEDERYTLEWETDLGGEGLAAPAENGQGTYFVHRSFDGD